MIEVSVAVAKTQLSSLLVAVEAGQSVVITRRGKPIADLYIDTYVLLAISSWSVTELLSIPWLYLRNLL